MSFPLSQPKPHDPAEDHGFLSSGDTVPTSNRLAVATPTVDEEQQGESNREAGASSLLVDEEKPPPPASEHEDQEEEEGEQELQRLLVSNKKVKKVLKDTFDELFQSKVQELSGTRSSLSGTPKSNGRGTLLFGISNNVSNQEEGNLDPDTFTLMMFAFPKTYKFWTKQFWNEEQAWLLGMFTCIAQILLGGLVIDDQVFTGDVYGKSILSIPVNVNSRPIYFAQLLTIPLALATQTDVITSLMTLQQLNEKSDWNEIIGVEEAERSPKTWRRRVLLPNVLKFLEGLFILFASWTIICQSDSVVDLLKDFTALFAISAVDDVMFVLADGGQLGYALQKKAREVKQAKVEQGGTQVSGTKMKAVMAIVLGIMMGGWLFIVVYGQHGGYLFRRAYPNCPRFKGSYSPQTSFGDGTCDWYLNSIECGRDGGDCDLFNLYSLNCPALDLKGFGDGKCDADKPFNIAKCGWDAGDCAHENYQEDLPDCEVPYPNLLSNGFCNDIKLYNLTCEDENEKKIFGDILAPYNTKDCRWDNGDCVSQEEYPGCFVPFARNISNGECDGGDYNTEECKFDGGDCLVEKYPDCHVDVPELIGNGICNHIDFFDLDSVDENRKQYYKDTFATIQSDACGIDGGDCAAYLELIEKHPDCHITVPEWIGNGICNHIDLFDLDSFDENRTQYYKDTFATIQSDACGIDGGDCTAYLELIKKYPDCHVDVPEWIGDGSCDHIDLFDLDSFDENRKQHYKDTFATIQSDACGIDGGDCTAYLQLIKKYPDCHIKVPEWIGDGFCHRIENYDLDSITDELLETLATIQSNACAYDDGDCCHVEFPNWIGDGLCHGGEYNTKECHFDGGDCENFNDMYPDCHITFPEWIGNGFCNRIENYDLDSITDEVYKQWLLETHATIQSDACAYDGGDCCHVQFPNRIGDGLCHGGDYNTKECHFDGGDCENFNDMYPDCHITFPEWIGNGFCNRIENYDLDSITDEGRKQWLLETHAIIQSPACDYDGGDCAGYPNN